jgi:hypothetical protein
MMNVSDPAARSSEVWILPWLALFAGCGFRRGAIFLIPFFAPVQNTEEKSQINRILL